MEHHLTKIKLIGQEREGVFPRFAKDDDQNFIDYDTSAEDYHADKSSMSASGIVKILTSKKNFAAYWLGMEEKTEEEKEASHFRLGRAVHMMILEPAKFKECYLIEPTFIGLTKDGRPSEQSGEAKAKRAAWWAGLTTTALVLDKKEHEALMGMVDSIMNHDVARNFFINGKPEVSGWATHELTGIRYRVRPDYFSYDDEGNLFLTDIKTTRADNKGLFSKDMDRLKYHVRMAMYKEGLTQIMKREPYRTQFVVVEKKLPWNTYVYVMNDKDLELGKMWFDRGMELLAEGLKSGRWPGPQTEAEEINLPNYSHYEPLPMLESDFLNAE